MREYNKIRNRLEKDELSLSIDTGRHPVTGEDVVRIASTGVMVEEVNNEFKELKNQYKPIAESIFHQIKQSDDSPLIDVKWEIGRLIVESDRRDFPNLQILGEILPHGYSSDSLSVCKQLYNAFPNKGYNTNHMYSEIEEFIMQPTNNDRGRKGYETYKEQGFEWPRSVRRAWCSVTEPDIKKETEIIESFIEQLIIRSNKNEDVGENKYSKYLHEMIITSTYIDRTVSKKEARSILEVYRNNGS